MCMLHNIRHRSLVEILTSCNVTLAHHEFSNDTHCAFFSTHGIQKLRLLRKLHIRLAHCTEHCTH